MATFVTGATGYIGSYVVAGLLERHRERLALLVRAKSRDEAERRLWQGLQLHMPFARFRTLLASRVDVILGDITAQGFGLESQAWSRLAAATESIVHIAASLNRRSDRVCFDVNLCGTLEVVKLAQAAEALHGLRRFSDVSTTAVAGERHGEVVHEDEAVSWSRHDYDPYARTKKFAEHMVRELLPGVPITVFRPSTVIGDSRHPRTTQFDMLRAVLFLARLRVLPLKPESRHDIVPADWVARAIVELHQRDELPHHVYHLSAGEASESHAQIMRKLRVGGRGIPHWFVPALELPVGSAAGWLSRTPRKLGVSRAAAMMDVFWPYIVFDTVFDNTRAVAALDEAPAPFTSYASPLCDFAIEHGFRYPYEPWPEHASAHEEAPSSATY